MWTSRRGFLMGTAIAGASVAMDGLSVLAEPHGAQAAGSSSAASGAAQTADTLEHTRGVGIYPGLPSADFGPELVPDTAYRNLALLRPAYHSSSYDYNLTAQLVTDGMKDTRLPEWVAISEGFRGELPKEEREYIVDHSPMSALELNGLRPACDIQLGGGESAPEVDRVQIFVVVLAADSSLNVEVHRIHLADGRTWQEAAARASLSLYQPPDIPRTSLRQANFLRPPFH